MVGVIGVADGTQNFLGGPPPISLSITQTVLTAVTFKGK
jgi:hypothetical protein